MSEPFRIVFSRQAFKYYKKIPLAEVRKIDKSLLSLEDNPFASGDIKPLKSPDKVRRYRLRVGDLRLIYQIDIKNRLILVSTLLPRGEVYKKL